VDVAIPLQRITVVTGPSGSGKSSLAFDTLYAEARRRYVDALSPQARAHLGPASRADVDGIDLLPPALALAQSMPARGPRSTVGTLTEVFDYLRLLFARIGRAHCLSCGAEIVSHAAAQIVDDVLALGDGCRLTILAPVVRAGCGEFAEELAALRKRGYSRVRVDGAMRELSDPITLSAASLHDIDVVVDRVVVARGARGRIAEGVEAALRLAGGVVRLVPEGAAEITRTDRFVCVACGSTFPEVSPRTFSFNSQEGACPGCNGLGEVFEAVMGSAPGRGRGEEAEPKRKDVEALLRKFREGQDEEALESALPYLRAKVCEKCGGARLRDEARAVRVCGLDIVELSRSSLSRVRELLASLPLSSRERTITARILQDVDARLQFLLSNGLGYLTLERKAASLSLGELQRIRLAALLSSGLAGVLFVLDEPTAGLHPRDSEQIVRALLALRGGGNTIVVVEHDPQVVLAADWVIDLGPGAGAAGGRVVAAGTPAEIAANPASPTGRVLRGEESAPLPRSRRAARGEIVLTGATGHNLRDVTLRVPAGVLACVCGVSGAGKTSLVLGTLGPAIERALRVEGADPLPHASLTVPKSLSRVVTVDASPLPRAARSNPATYTGIFTHIRQLFAELPEARARGFDPARFSFNQRGGRCEVCQGEGETVVSMRFLPDVLVRCEVCDGRRYDRETLEVKYRGASIADVLDLSAEAALDLLGAHPRIRERLVALRDVGLGYMPLGQSASALSGGEARRLKLARELARPSADPALYLLDEPTTGLHGVDVRRLLEVLSRLVDAGHSVLVIEHDLEVLKTADHLIELGPGGGPEGGHIVAQGTPDEVARDPKSATGPYLSRALTAR
jgi:excinuclease ABC subunit A